MTNQFEYKEFIKHLANISGKIIRNYFRADINIDSKADDSPVTIADRKAEEVMREEIMKNYPEHGIIGEEFGNYNESAEYKWTLDPIDGTKSFICGALSFGTLIALLKNGKPLLGVIHQPVLKELLIGYNKFTEINGIKTSLRDCKKLSNSVLLTTDHLNIGRYQNQKSFEELIKKVKLYRNWGDCYGYYLVATGFADIMIDPIMSVWDSLPLVPIIKGAGGIITDYQGNNPVGGSSIIAASPGIHSTVINTLKN